MKEKKIAREERNQEKLALQISIQLSRLLPLFFLEKDNSSGDNPVNYLWKDWKEQ